MAYTGMCRWTGYGFWPLCPKQGIQFYVSVPNSVCILPRGPKMKGVVVSRVETLRYFRALLS